MGSWHEEMASAVAARKKAMSGVNRWQGKLSAAEKRIEELSAQQQTTAPLPPPATLIEEAAQAGLRPVFGVTTA